MQLSQSGARFAPTPLPDTWQPDADHYDNEKINGLTLPRKIRSFAFTKLKDIEHCDPLALPLSALVYQGTSNFSLRKLAHGREFYVIPTFDIATTVFISDFLKYVRAKGLDLNKLSSQKALADEKTLDKSQCCDYLASELANVLQSWELPVQPDPAAQHQIHQLQSQIAALQQQLSQHSGSPGRAHQQNTGGSAGPSDGNTSKNILLEHSA